MKIQSMCVFLVFLTLFNLFASKSEVEKLEVQLEKANVSGYFYLQQIYAGSDPLLLVKFSQKEMTLKYFTLTAKVLAVSPSLEKVKTIEGKFHS